MMFGPSDGDSQHSDLATQWKIKRFSNDDLRQKFIDATIPQGEHLGLTFPDNDLKWNEKTNHYDIGEIDWAEFKRVIAGNGPCNKDRMKQRKAAHENGAWVREASEAYASKRMMYQEAAE
jgi:ring-1,2-phenylacetyl-CoA epoxidase subunit PaaA